MSHPIAEQTLNALNWPVIQDELEKNLLTPHSKKLLTSLFYQEQEQAQQQLKLVFDASSILFQQGVVGLEAVWNILPTLDRVSKNGAFQTAEELSEFYATLSHLTQWIRQWHQFSAMPQYKTLQQYFQKITLPNEAIDILEPLAVIPPLTGLRETASERYQQLAQKQQELKSRIFQKLQGIAHSQHLRDEEGLITERDGRYLVAVRSENRNKIDGPIIDTSSSGLILYIEPQSVRPLLNQLRETESDLHQEIQKLLKSASQQVQPLASEIREFINAVAEFDLLQSKAELAKKLDSQLVTFADEINLKQARHPILVLQDKHQVISNDIYFKEKALLISGPNAGGKTVTLKLTGLYALMLKAGIPVPCEVDSQFPWFKNVDADIGDTQSLEQNLSTFTAHLTQVNHWLSQNNLKGHLILIDEICAGTDPVEAACLAESILNELVKRDATVVVSSHLNALKKLAYQHPQFQNACVLFNEETFKPTYKLVIGASGQSHALSIAKQMGLPSGVVQAAQQQLTERQSTSDELLETLEIQQAELARKQQDVSALQAVLEKQKFELNEQYNRLQGEKRQILDHFKKEVRDKFAPIEKQITDVKSIIKQRQNKLTPSTSRYVSKKLNSAQSQTNQLIHEYVDELQPKGTIPWEKIKVGDKVTTRSLNMRAQVVEKHEHNKTLTLQAGLVKTIVPLDEIFNLDEANQQQSKKLSPAKKQKLFSETNKKPKVITKQCDVRGMLLEDAIGVVEKFLDDALMDKDSMVAVVHGVGTGSLKNGLRSELSQMDFIQKYYAAPAVEGGDGKTIIEL